MAWPRTRRFVLAHGAALYAQGVDGRRRQLLEVSGLNSAQVALGVDVHPYRLGDLRTEPLGQPVRTLMTMPVIPSCHEIPAGDRAGEVPDVVQQRSGDQRRRGSGLLGERGRLEHVSRLGNRLAEVVCRALAREQVGDDLDRALRRRRHVLSLTRRCQGRNPVNRAARSR